METQNLKLEDIQAGNEAARKKLEGFRSGLQKLMNKKSKKLSHHEPPSHDFKSPSNKKQQNYFSNNSANSASSQYNPVQPASGGQFGFNSTLFRQIGDDTVIQSNPSGLYVAQMNQKYAYNSVSNTEYFSISSKPSTKTYEQKMESGGSQNFAKASKLFSEVEDIINKSKKTVKLPVKPIQKYFDKIQENLSVSNVEDFDLNMSGQGMRFDQGVKLSPRKETKLSMKLGKNEEIQENKKVRSISAKDELKNASSFLKNYKGKGELMKSPPLPPSFPKEDMSKRLRQEQARQQSKKNISRYYQLQEQEIKQKNVSKSAQRIYVGQNSVQMHKNKLKQTLHERKKMMKEDGILDDSIELELSDEQHQDDQGFKKQKNQQQILKLIKQKQLLLQELEQIQHELDRLENQ